MKNFINSTGTTEKTGFYSTLHQEYSKAKVLCNSWKNTSFQSLSLFKKLWGKLQETQKSLEVVEKIKKNELEAKTAFYIGRMYHIQGEFQKATKFLEISEEIFRKLKKLGKLSRVLNEIGEINRNSKVNSKISLEYFTKALEYAKKVQNKKKIVKNLYSIGRYKIERKILLESSESLNLSLDIAKSIGYSKGIVRALNGIGVVFLEQKKTLEALKIFQESLQLSRKIGDKMGESVNLFSISEYFERATNYKVAVKYCEKSLGIRQEIGYLRDNSFVFFVLSKQYQSMGNDEQSLRCCEESVKIERNFGNFEKEIIALFGLFVFYSRKKDYKKARDVLNRCLEIAIKRNFKDFEDYTLFCFSDLYLNEERYKKSLDSLKLILKRKREKKKNVGFVDEALKVPFVMGKIGKVYLIMENYKKGIEVYEEILKMETCEKLLKKKIVHELSTCYFNYGRLIKYFNCFDYYITLCKELNVSEKVVERKIKAVKEFFEKGKHKEVLKEGLYIKDNLFQICNENAFVDTIVFVKNVSRL